MEFLYDRIDIRVSERGLGLRMKIYLCVNTVYISCMYGYVEVANPSLKVSIPTCIYKVRVFSGDKRSLYNSSFL